VPATRVVKPARKAARPPPVIDRTGVALGTAPNVTGQVSLPEPTDGAASPAVVSPVTPAVAAVDSPALTAPALPSIAASDTSTAIATSTAQAPTTPAPSTAPSGSTASAAPIDVTAIPIMAPPPSVTVPVAPSGFVPVPGADLKGYRPMQSELACVPDAVMELQSVPNWGLIFGITAPPAAQVAQRLSVASQWTGLLSDSQEWLAYVKSQEGMAWKDGLEVMETLKAPFQLATTANPAMLKQYPALQRLLGAQKVVAKKAVSTKKKNKATAAANAAAAASATPATAPAVTAAPDATTPARVVTVSG